MKLSIFLIAAVLVAAGCVGSTQPGAQGITGETQAGPTIVEITPNGFETQVIEVSAGSTVRWLNRDGVQHWPASAVHPTHSAYPGSGIEKCGTGEKIFDACRGLANGETFEFTFNERGEWRYHDHLNTAFTGAVIVK